MKDITIIYDTSIASENIGDQIIMDSVYRNFLDSLPGQIVGLPTHDQIGQEGRRLLKESSRIFVGGSNLLSSHVLSYRQWKFGIADIMTINQAVLVGVGWWQYQSKPDWLTSKVYRRLFSDTYTHSVRDDYTKEMLLKIGIENVVNTGCPTMWALDPDQCKRIPCTKGKGVVFTLTDYLPSFSQDLRLVTVLLQSYEDIYFWPQGSGDQTYLAELMSQIDSRKPINILDSKLKSFDNVFRSGEVEYVGTRLHAGIRALQNGARSTIIAIDNRAKEKAKFGFHVIDRKESDMLLDFINRDMATDIKIHTREIKLFKEQFLQI
ncbi:MAG: polysaccharide pyruvyl transferase family protein [Oceanospirillaceae bacterium]|nr:polysaccharide pyruvyl transferase family protein [Oceanospirillaceae bacterium]